MKPADLSELCTPTEAGPNLLPATLDLWCQTCPRPWPDPDVSYFLHGRNADDSPDVRIVWRADLTEQNEGVWVELVELMPPASAESIPIPVYAARAWLNQEAVTASEVADAERYKVPETKPVEDIAELAFRRQTRFRVSGKMLSHWFTAAAQEPPDLTFEVDALSLVFSIPRKGSRKKI